VADYHQAGARPAPTSGMVERMTTTIEQGSPVRVKLHRRRAFTAIVRRMYADSVEVTDPFNGATRTVPLDLVRPLRGKAARTVLEREGRG
jgi:hypothetical protein